MNRHKRHTHRAFSILLLGVASQSFAAVFNEVEPNDSKPAANGVTGMAAGDSIVGNSTSGTGSGLDYFRVQTAAAPPAIYQHTLAITTTGTAGHTGTLRALSQSSGVITPGTDSTLQTSITSTLPARANRWYGFGKQEEVYYRVTGTAGTTQNYTSALSTQTIVPLDLGTFVGGNITITTVGQGHATDTDLWVYDGNLNAIVDYGNDDESVAGGGTGATLQSRLTRSYGPGTYYLALSNYNVSNNQASPPDDDYRGGSVLDFPDAAANSATNTGLLLNFQITDSAGPRSFIASKTEFFQIYWATFTVLWGPSPEACCLSGGGCLDTDSSSCAMQGGSPQGPGTNCATAFCTPAPEACCLPSGGCLDTDPTSCDAQAGSPQGPGTECVTAGCSQPAYACCIPGGGCVEIDPSLCAMQGGTAYPGQYCAPGFCPPPTEACCLPAGGCSDIDPSSCTMQGGTLQGPGTNCATAGCTQNLQACCLPGGMCSDIDPMSCSMQGGSPQGPGTNCATAVCTPGLEACCLPGGGCADFDPASCTIQGGASQGPGTDCATVSCSGEPEACCFSSGACSVEPPMQCQGSGGVPGGPGSTCMGDANFNGMDDLCEAPVCTDADDFDDGVIDAARWSMNNRPFESGATNITITEFGGQVHLQGTATGNYWGGAALATVQSHTASPSQPLVVEIDRVSMIRTGIARSGVCISDAAHTTWVLFTENQGEGGWQVNSTTGTGGNAGPGMNIAAFDGAAFDDGLNHHIKLVADGTGMDIYLDNLFGIRANLPLASGIVIEVGAYIREISNTVDAKFDNLCIQSAGGCLRVSRDHVAAVAGDPAPSIQVTIPAGWIQNEDVSVTVTSDAPAVAAPQGAVAGSLALVFPEDGPTTQSFDLDLLEAGRARLSVTPDNGGCVEVGVIDVLVAEGVLASDDFDDGIRDEGLWVEDLRGIESGRGIFAASESPAGYVEIGGTETTNYWGGMALRAWPTFDASESKPLIIEIDRVLHTGTGSSQRTGLWVADAMRSAYLFFSYNANEGGWVYNRSIFQAGDNAGGPGANIAAFDAAGLSDGGAHRMKLAVTGQKAWIFLDDVFGGEIEFPIGERLLVEFGAYARSSDTPDTVQARFDAFRVAGSTDVFPLDTDGDGLSDAWETAGIDANGDGTVDLDLPAMGADPDHKDLFVEVDAMSGFTPASTTIPRVIAAFAQAPNALVDNPDGLDGINLHMALDETNLPYSSLPDGVGDVPSIRAAYYGSPADRANPNWPNMRAAREQAFRYCVWGDGYGAPTNTSSGQAELPGNDLIVTLGRWPVVGGTEDQQAGTLMHELGHTLGLHHGGADGINFKPNYHSIMSYLWQVPQGVGINIAYLRSWTLDYSRELWPTLDENNLMESAGIDGHLGHWSVAGPVPIHLTSEYGPVDWSRDCDVDDAGVVADINWFSPSLPTSPGELLIGHEDWSNIWYGVRGHAYFLDGLGRGTVEAPVPPEELTAERFLELMEATQQAPEERSHCGRPGDSDGNGWVDLLDLAEFQDCFSGEGGGPVDETCEFADLDHDGDVDLTDYAMLIPLIAGP